MSHNTGRDVTLSWNGTAYAGIRENSISLNGELIDVTDGGSSGRRELLDSTARDEVNVSLSGLYDDDGNALKIDWFARNRIRAVVITYPNGDTLSGNFGLTSYSEGAPYEDAVTFDAELQSTGEITYTEA
jgi:TP901-1 family phage major tail protein